jgi:Tfp pilus assembly protein PilN
MALSLSIPKELRKLAWFGQGAGIQIAGPDLEVAVTRVRPSGAVVTGRFSLANFAARPAAEWGAEYSAHLRRIGASHLAATVLLPRRDVIARTVTLPGVSASDLEGAIRFQLDSLHPYGEDEVAWGWSPLSGGAAMVGIARRATLERYAQLFVEAGIAVASFTFSAAAIHAGLDLNGGAPAEGFYSFTATVEGAVEVYGQSPAKPVFSAELESASPRAAALAASELRLPADTPPRALEELLPVPRLNPLANDLARNPLPYAASLAAACPHLAPAANLLPAELRKSTSRTMLVPTLALAAALLLTAGAMLAYSRIADREYLKRIDAEIRQLEPQARRAAALDREIDTIRARTRLLDEFRGRTRADLDALNELTRLVPPTAWTNAIDLARDNARIAGEAPQASSMLKILDSSPLFENSEFSLITKSQNSELFQIRTTREARK